MLYTFATGAAPGRHWDSFQCSPIP